MLVEVDDDVMLGGGGGDATPGESIVPANAERASAIVRIATAHSRRTLLTFLYLPEIYKNFCITLDDRQVFLQGWEDLG